MKKVLGKREKNKYSLGLVTLIHYFQISLYIKVLESKLGLIVCLIIIILQLPHFQMSVLYYISEKLKPPNKTGRNKVK